MSNERLAVDLSDGYLVILGSIGRGKNVRLKESLVKVFKYDLESLVKEVAEYIEREEMSSPEIFLALDCRQALIKSYFFPFRAAGKIEAALNFELERSLPVKTEDIYSDWIYGPRVGNGTIVTAGCIELKELDHISEAFKSAGLKIVDIVEGGAPLTKVSAVQTADKRKLIVDLGRERTALYNVEEGLLRHRDLFLRGVNHIISALQSDSVSHDAAGRMVLLTDFSQESIPEEAAGATGELKKLAAQIANYVHLYAEKTGFTPDLVEICGEGCEITGIDRLVEEAVSVKSVVLLPRDMLSLFEDNVEVGNTLRAYGLLQIARSERLSFLREDDKAGQSAGVRHAKYAAGWAAVLVVSFLIFFVSNLYYKSRVISSTEGKIDAVISESLPGIQGGFSHAQQVSIINTRINELKRKLRNNSGGAGSAIEVLRVIHKEVQKSLKITLDEMTLDPRRLALSGTALNFKDVESFRTALDKSKFFNSVSIKGAAAEKKTKKVRFTLELLRKPAGE